MGPKQNPENTFRKEDGSSKRTAIPARLGPRGRVAAFSGWQRERADALQSVFLRVERRRGEVGSVARCLKPFVRRWKGNFFHCDPKRQVRFSFGTLRNLYYFWLANGRTADCLFLRYCPTIKRTVSASLLAEFISNCCCPGSESLSQAYRDTREAFYQLWNIPGQRPDFPSRKAFMRALTPAQRSAIINLQQANLAVLAARNAMKRLFD